MRESSIRPVDPMTPMVTRSQAARDLDRIQDLTRAHPALWRLVQTIIVTAWLAAHDTLPFTWGVMAAERVFLDLLDGRMDNFVNIGAIISRLV